MGFFTFKAMAVPVVEFDEINFDPILINERKINYNMSIKSFFNEIK